MLIGGDWAISFNELIKKMCRQTRSIHSNYTCKINYGPQYSLSQISIYHWEHVDENIY